MEGEGERTEAFLEMHPVFHYPLLLLSRRALRERARVRGSKKTQFVTVRGIEFGIRINPVLIDQGMPDPEPTLAELRWRSRRGTRELDLILLGFLSAGFENLTPQDRRAYATLLDASDPDLMSWLLGQAIPDDPEIGRLVQAIRTQFFSMEVDRPAPART